MKENWIDLSVPWKKGLQTYPSVPGPKVEIVHDHHQAAVQILKAMGFSEEQIRSLPNGPEHPEWLVQAFVSFGDHSGTHLDSPYHFSPEGKHIGLVEPSICQGPVYILDCRKIDSFNLENIKTMETQATPNQEIKDTFLVSEEELRIAGEKIGYTPKDVSEGDILLLRTDAASDERYLKPEYISAYPGIAPEGFRHYLKAGIKIIGIDAPSVDPPVSVMKNTGDLWPAHIRLGREFPEYMHYENLTNLNNPRLKARGSSGHFFGFPLPIYNATASPCRCVINVSK